MGSKYNIKQKSKNKTEGMGEKGESKLVLIIKTNKQKIKSEKKLLLFPYVLKFIEFSLFL